MWQFKFNAYIIVIRLKKIIAMIIYEQGAKAEIKAKILWINSRGDSTRISCPGMLEFLLRNKLLNDSCDGPSKYWVCTQFRRPHQPHPSADHPKDNNTAAGHHLGTPDAAKIVKLRILAQYLFDHADSRSWRYGDGGGAVIRAEAAVTHFTHVDIG